ncbi:hypothetical protein ACLKA6_000522 [Drosophila palustris]
MAIHMWMWMSCLRVLLPLLLISHSYAANLSQLAKKQTPVKQQSSQQQVNYAQELELPAEQQELKSEEDEDPYQMMQHDMKQDSRLPVAASNNYAWNPYAAINPPINPNPYESLPSTVGVGAGSGMPMAKMLPFIGYAQPVLIPFPLYIAPDMFYPSVSVSGANELDDVVMSRAAGGDRRPLAPHSPLHSAHSPRNSPIYYVRLPPTPYMFVPTNLAPGPFGGSFSPLLTYQPMPTFSTFGSVFNLPVNFVANGKPSSVYQMNQMAPFPATNLGGNSFNLRPPTPSNPYRPTTTSTGGYGQSFGLSTLPAPQQDSKLTALKRPFVFNGRPEDIYILPNNLYNYNEPAYY